MAKKQTKGHPLWRFDRQQLRNAPYPALIGVDEAGRGCLAGPVVAAVAHIPADAYDHVGFKRASTAINDSKQLKAEQREAQFTLIEQWTADKLVAVAPGVASVEEIEVHNILGATRLAMQRALDALELTLLRADSVGSELLKCDNKVADYPRIMVDGKPLKPFPWAHEAVVGGDGKSLAIAMASIVAKVTRDRVMLQLHEEDPRFGYDQHKGYGTPRHLEALRAHGPTPHHRKVFLRKLDLPANVCEQRELF
ncbi:ribonuclease HII [Cerasicoccus maritimus]|uniref:ribonuclease HII n=1 Tax=Cerasicoccus maritimus TaxID=490089 RepID=UPI002852D796|nr:ribonuclease HII [Cerasicoccus maritimus]